MLIVFVKNVKIMGISLEINPTNTRGHIIRDNRYNGLLGVLNWMLREIG
jgi:hypothetical protein